MNHKLSIVLPVYNGERYLRQSIDSVLAQSYGDFDLLICNDASTDNSAEIIGSYHDRRIRVSHHRANIGLFKTLNRTIDQTSGEWVRLWSQDDVMKPNCLEIENDFCNRYSEVGLGFCSYDLIDETGAVFQSLRPFETPPILSRPNLDQLLFYRGCLPGNISTVVLKRAALKEVGNFAETMRIAGDFELWVRISRRYSFFYVKEHLISVRSHSGQLSKRKDSYLVCMREEKTIYDELAARLPSQILSYARWYDCFTRQARYVHHAFRHALARDLISASAVMREVLHSDHAFLAVVFWLLSGNQRLFKVPARYSSKPGNSTTDFTSFLFSTERAK